MRSFPVPEPGAPDRRSPARLLWWLVRTNSGAITLSIVHGVVWMVAQALVPAAIGKTIDDGIVPRDQGAILRWGGVVLALGLVQAATGISQDRAGRVAGLGASYRTMQVLTRHASALGATLARRTSTGGVVSVGVGDIDHLDNLIGLTARVFGAVASIVVVAAIMLSASWQLGLVVLIGVPLILWALALLLRPLHGRQQRLRDRQGELTSRAVDIVSGLRVLRGIGGEDVFARRYREESQRARWAGVEVAGVEALLDGVRILLPGLLVAFVVWLGARRVLAGQLSPGQLVAFYGYAVFLAVPLRRLTMTTGLFMKGYVAAQRVVRLLALEPEIASATPAAIAPGPGAVLADPVSGLVVHPRRLTGVVCASTADAATLADRLGRYVESGATYGGVPLRKLAVDEVRRRILVAGNDAALFSGTLRTELDPADRAVPGSGVLEEVLDRASARDIVDALPEGLDAAVVGAGREFSGGQQQRLRLVRALMADPDVLLLVEPTSAVDAHTESRVGERIGAGRTGRATVVFTTSPILLDHTDRVSFVEDGTVVAEGTHEELLRTEPRYRYVVTRDVDAE